MKKILLCLLFTFHCFAQSIGEDNNQFAFSLYSKIGGYEGNIAFSPYGIFSNLALLYFGAAGETASQVKTVLHLSGKDEPFLKAFNKQLTGLTTPSERGYKLHIANALFPHEDVRFLSPFQEIATQTFHAELQAINFGKPAQATETINNWISNKTEKKIPNMLQEGDLDSSTRLVVANAVYFNGDWVYPFESKATKPGLFHVADKPPIEVQMLQQTHSFSYFENDELQGVSLPFIRQGTEQPLLECVVLLPRNSIVDLENILSNENLSKWISSSHPTTLNLQIPKFCIKKRISLNEPLIELGMSTAFSFGADFSKINGTKDLFLSRVIHETYFSFKENGVTAASATTSSLSVKSIYIPPEKVTPFIADHPFLFLIIDTHSKAILFMGRVTHPTAEKCDEN
ncbi:MAG: serpin family protein [Verrucomicrobia bacterium]|nr:serpin family protein [Verrucomicrobiota bacterium]